jgi:hypothetical protein
VAIIYGRVFSLYPSVSNIDICQILDHGITYYNGALDDIVDIEHDE